MNWSIEISIYCLAIVLTWILASFISLEPNPLEWTRAGRITFIIFILHNVGWTIGLLKFQNF